MNIAVRLSIVWFAGVLIWYRGAPIDFMAHVALAASFVVLAIVGVDYARRMRGGEKRVGYARHRTATTCATGCGVAAVFFIVSRKVRAGKGLPRILGGERELSWHATTALLALGLFFFLVTSQRARWGVPTRVHRSLGALAIGLAFFAAGLGLKTGNPLAWALVPLGVVVAVAAGK